MTLLVLLPALLMCAVLPFPRWPLLARLSSAALGAAVLTSLLEPAAALPWLAYTRPAGILAVLVQLLGVAIAGFSARYLRGEAHQRGYVRALAGVLAAVQVLLLADHWLVLIGAWAAVGVALERLLCFYPERPFALLAAHKKRLADRAADVLLVAAALCSWHTVGSGGLAALADFVTVHGATGELQAAAVCLALAVILRTALLPVHGWLIQVMEAPTPVSALLHAGVVNLGGLVLIRFAPLLAAVPLARGLLVAAGLSSAVLAGLVLLTRVSIKVRLAWSTVAQMGFMLAECGLGLYTLALLHLIGHSLYKAQAFLWSGDTVHASLLARMRPRASVAAYSLALAPLAAWLVTWGLPRLGGAAAWPQWWSGVLALAWAPLLWTARGGGARAAAGGVALVVLTGAALLAHACPLGVADRPDARLGYLALTAMFALYGVLALLHTRPALLLPLHRASFAGFYLDERFTRLALRWPPRQAPRAVTTAPVCTAHL